MSTISVPYSGTATIGTTEWSLTNDSSTIATKTDQGVLQVVLDLSALTATEVFEMYFYEKVISSGSQKRCRRYTFSGVQQDDGAVSPSMAVKHGWDVTLKKISGTDRSITWSVRLI